MSQHKNELKTAELSFFGNMDFGKLVCKFHIQTPLDELQYVPNFQAYITITSVE